MKLQIGIPIPTRSKQVDKLNGLKNNDNNDELVFVEQSEDENQNQIMNDDSFSKFSFFLMPCLRSNVLFYQSFSHCCT